MVNETTGAIDSEDSLRWFEFPGWRWAFNYILVWLMPTLLAAGVVLNLLCFITILRHPKTFPKICRRSMLLVTALDVIVLSICGTYYYQTFWQSTYGVGPNPVTLFRHMHSGTAACFILNYLWKYLINGAPFFHLALTAERVLVVTLPLRVKQIATARNHCILLLALLVLGSIGPALWAAEQEYHDGRCRSLRNEVLVLAIDAVQYHVDFYLSKVGLFAALLLGCVIVAAALKLQSRAAAKMQSSNSSAGNASSSKRRKLVGTCLVMIFMNVVFLLSHAPRAALSLYEGYSYTWDLAGTRLTEDQWDLYYQLLYALTFLHNIADPLAYFIGGNFRSAFKQNLRDMAHMAVTCFTAGRRKSMAASGASSAIESRS